MVSALSALESNATVVQESLEQMVMKPIDKPVKFADDSGDAAAYNWQRFNR